MNEDVIRERVQPLQRQLVDKAAADAVPGAVIHVVRREDELLAEELQVQGEQHSLDTRELAEPQDVEQLRVYARGKHHQRRVVLQNPRDFRQPACMRILVPDEIVEDDGPDGAFGGKQLAMSPGHCDVHALRGELACEPTHVMAILPTGQQGHFHGSQQRICSSSSQIVWPTRMWHS